MNDPHVVALHYKIEHVSWIDYSRADPLECREPGFDVRVANERVRFSMTDHFATEQDARLAVADFIRGWEIDAALERQPGTFVLCFEKSEIVDRSPTPGEMHVRPDPARFTFTTSQPEVIVSAGTYPKPPSPRLASSPKSRTCSFTTPDIGRARNCCLLWRTSASKAFATR